MKELDSLLQRVFFVPVAAVRPYLVLKGTLFVLAFDLWLTRISHGGRYGAGGFNVAHFAWLDAIQPNVSADLYVGLCTLTGILCFALALAPRPPRWLLGAAFALHTWSWAMSMLDSYQHHYLLSIVLLALVFFPRLSAEEALLPPEPKRANDPAPKAKRGKREARPVEPPAQLMAILGSRPPTTYAWAYVALAWGMAVVYAYTAISKTSDEWLSGAAMRRVVGLPASGEAPADARDPVAPLRWLASLAGFEGESFWTLLGHSVVVVQIVCAIGYLVAPFRDTARSKVASLVIDVVASIGLVTALSFHFGAEHMNLKIGWFSWYMIAYALVMLLPARPIAFVLRASLPLAHRAIANDLLVPRIGFGLLAAMVGLYTYVERYRTLIKSEALREVAETFFDPAVILTVAATLVLATPIRVAMRSLLTQERFEARSVAAATTALALAALAFAGWAIDLPGVLEAAVLAGLALVAARVVVAWRRADGRVLHAYSIGAALGAMAFFVVVWQSDVRYDFWRNVGGDHTRRGELEVAYAAYVKANCYGADARKAQEDDARRRLEERGMRVPEVRCTLPRNIEED